MADVLLVEDDAVLRTMLADILTGLGHRVHAVNDAEAVTGPLLRQLRPAMVITDLVLPGRSGDVLCAALGKVRQALGMKLLLISDSLEDELAALAGACGADGYATKAALLSDPSRALASLLESGLGDRARAPASTDVIQAAVTHHLAEHHPRRQARADCALPFKGKGLRSGFEGKIHNLSLAGARVVCGLLLEVGERVNVSFTLESPVQASARVTWSVPSAAAEEFTAGLDFLELPSDVEAQLERWIQRSLPELYPPAASEAAEKGGAVAAPVTQLVPVLPRATYRNGLIAFVDRAAFELEMEQILSHGLFWVTVDGPPPPLEQHAFQVVLPNRQLLAIEGRIVSLPEPSRGLIEIVMGTESLFKAMLTFKYEGRRKDLRKLPRTFRRLKVRMGTEDTRTLDVSPGGICVETDQVLPVGALVRGILYLDRKEIPYQGEARWCSVASPEKRERGRVGLRFISISDDYFELFKAPPRASAEPPATTPAAPAPPHEELADPSSEPIPGSTGRDGEKRRLKRTRKRLKVRIAGTTGFTVDISPRGIGIELTKVIVPGKHVHGTLYIDDKEVGFDGQVRWARAGQAHLNIRAKMGILLTSIPNEFFLLFRER